MKTLILTLGAGLLMALASCTESIASGDHSAPHSPENGAQFKEGKGISVTSTMAKAINLQTAEVSEEDLTPVIFLQLQTIRKGSEAVGWISPEQATSVKPGAKVNLHIRSPKPMQIEGTVTGIIKDTAPGGESEIIVRTERELDAGLSISGTLLLDEAKGLTAIPKSALLSTAEGNFVYAKNDEYYMRTPVKLGAESGGHVEITDGLYSGDEIVTTPVMSLWLAELQVLRGGKACTCGH